MLFGPPNIGKSFLALDLAYSVGLGQRWMKRRVIPGRVMYVAAGEGVSGLKSRLAAWETFYETEAENVEFLTDAVQLHQTTHVHKFLKTVKPLDPTLVIFDTLARCFVGGDENSVQDMGQAIGAADEIRAATGATVLFVHHTGRPDQEGRAHERGSSALPAAVDFMYELAEHEGQLKLFCRKQKDAERAFPQPIVMRKVRRAGRELSLIPEAV